MSDVVTPQFDDEDRSAARRARAMASGHSRLVRRLRIVLPVVAVVIVAGLVAAAMLPSFIGPGVDVGSIGLSTEGLVMANPKLSGRDGDRSYEVTADRAVQSLTNPKLVELEGIVANITLPGDNWVKLSARHGLYNSEAEALALTEGITVASRDGDDATLASADVDLKTGAVKSADPVEIRGPRGTIRAGAASVAGEGDAIVFTDGVSLTFNPPAEASR